MSVPDGRGSSRTAKLGQPARRVRHEVADAVRVAVMSLVLSAAVALLLSFFAHLVATA